LAAKVAAGAAPAPDPQIITFIWPWHKGEERLDSGSVDWHSFEAILALLLHPPAS